MEPAFDATGFENPASLSAPVSEAPFSETLEAVAYLVARGVPLLEISKTLEVSGNTLTKILADPGFSDLVRDRLPSIDDVRAIAIAKAMPAARIIGEVMEGSTDDSERRKAAKDILALAGVAAIKRVEIAVFSPDAAKRRVLRESLREVRDAVRVPAREKP